jgi:hypothetical protein
VPQLGKCPRCSSLSKQRRTALLTQAVLALVDIEVVELFPLPHRTTPDESVDKHGR